MTTPRAGSQNARILAASLERPQWATRIAIDDETGCWVWLGAKTTGYGYVTFHRKNWLVHRLFYETLNGPLPDGMQLHHVCERRACVNPSHVVPVSQAEHSAAHGYGGFSRGWEKRRAMTHCHRGHEFTPENTRLKTGKDGITRRICRTCSRISNVACKRRAKERRTP